MYQLYLQCRGMYELSMSCRGIYMMSLPMEELPLPMEELTMPMGPMEELTMSMEEESGGATLSPPYKGDVGGGGEQRSYADLAKPLLWVGLWQGLVWINPAPIYILVCS